MPNSVDEKVVQLTLDNKQFNKASSDTINSIEKLKKTLEFEGAIDSFDQLDKSIKDVDFSSIDKGVDGVGKSFTILDTITDAVFRNMTNRVIDFGERTIKSLSTDQIMTGWNKYAEQTGAVQTIMAATAQQFDDTALQMETVNEQLEKLTWFTDETSHKFNDMVGGIGKFTANNIDLETSVKAMEGIATWASLSGANTNEASRAIYNLAQAISVGSVKLIDWRSIENANMGTTEFKNTVLQTAEALGTLRKTADGAWKTLSGKDVSVANFSENLSEGWFNSQVLLKSLEAYGGFADRLNQFVDETGILTATAMNFIDDYVDGTLDMGDAMKATGLNAEELTSWLEELGSAENDLGRRAFRAAQETKTFQEAIDYVKEAVSSGWSTSFKYIFGDYLEAKEWWSEIAETMYDVFVVGGEIRNTILSIWKDRGGRDDFLNGIREIITNFTDILDIFKDAWNEVWFGDEEDQIENQANALLSVTKAFKDFAEAIKPTEETAQNLRDILKALFGILKTGANIVKSITKGLSPLLNLLNMLAGTLLQMFGDLARLINSGLESFFTEQRMNSIENGLRVISSIISGVLQVGLVAVFSIVERLTKALGNMWNRFQEAGGGIRGVITVLVDTFNDFWQSFMDGETIVNGVVDGILFIFGGLAAGIKTIINTIIGLITGELTFKDLFTGEGSIGDSVKGFGEILDKLQLQDKINNIVQWIKDFINGLSDADNVIVNFVNNITNAIGYLYDRLKGLLDKLTIQDIKDLLLIAILWQFVTGINKLNTSMSTAISNIGGTFKSFNNIISSLTGNNLPILDKLNLMFNKTKFLQIGIAITLLVAALGKLNTLDYEKTQQSVAALGVTMAMLLAAFKAFQKIIAAMPKKEKNYELEKVLNGLGKNMAFIGASALMIAQAMKVLNETLFDEEGKFDWERYGIILANVVGLTIGLAAVTRVMGSVSDKGIGNLVSIIGIAAGIRLIVESVRVLDKIGDISKIEVGCAGVAAIILSLGLAVKAMESINWRTALATIPLISAFATSLTVLTAAIGILAALASGNNLAGALGTFFFEVVGMTASLVILGKALKNVPATTILSISAAMMAFASSFIILAAAMKWVENYNWDESSAAIFTLAGGFILISTSLGVLGRVLKNVNPNVISTIATTMVAMSGSILILAGALKMVEGITWESIDAGVLTIAAMLGVFSALAGVVAYFDSQVFGMFSQSLINTAEAFLKFGLAVTAVSAGIFLLSAATGIMAVIVGAFQALGEKLGLDLPEMISNGFDTLEIIIREFLEMIRNLAPDFFMTFVSLFGLIATAIFAVKHPTALAVAGVIMEILSVIENHGEDIINTLVNVINLVANATALFDALSGLISKIATFIGEGLIVGICGVFGGLVKGLGKCLGNHVDVAMGEAVTVMNKSYNDAIMNLSNQANNEAARKAAAVTMGNLIQGWIDGEEELSDAMVSTGLNSMKTFADAAGGDTKEAIDKILAQLAQGIDENKEGFKDQFGILAEYSKKGYGEGLDPTRPFDYFRNIIGDEMYDMLAEGVNAYGGNWASLFSDLGTQSGNGFLSGLEGVLSGVSLTNLLVGNQKDTGKTGQSNVDESLKSTDPGEYYRQLHEERQAELNKEVKKSGEETGVNYMAGIEDGISKGTGGAAKQAKTAAQTIAEAFSEELNKINKQENTGSLLYNLWKASNPNATETELAAKEIEYQTQQVQYSVQKAQVAQEKYQRMLAEVGQSATETHDAFDEMIKAQTELLENQAKLNELQKGTADSSQEAWMRYNDVIQQWSQAQEGMESTLDWMRRVGFSNEEIMRAVASKANYALPQAMSDIQDTAGDAANAAAENTTLAFIEQLGNYISEQAPMFYTMGGSFIEPLSKGVSNRSEDVSSSLKSTLSNATDAILNDYDLNAKYKTAGINIAKGAIEGNESMADEVRDSIVEIIGSDPYEATKDFTQINSPSGLYRYIGEMIDVGLIKGIEARKSAVINAAVDTAVAAYKAACAGLGIASPSRLMEEVGMYFDLGLANGIDKYSDKVKYSSSMMVTNVSKSTESAFSDTSDQMKRYLQDMFGLDEDALHIKVIIDADSSNFDHSMSELERAHILSGMGMVPSSTIQSQTFAGTIGGERYSASMNRLADEEAYRSIQLQNLYDLVDGYFQTKRVDEFKSDASNQEPTNITFTQNNYSPKAISRTETYRNTQRQFNSFAQKFSIRQR